MAKKELKVYNVICTDKKFFPNQVGKVWGTVKAYNEKNAQFEADINTVYKVKVKLKQ